MHKGCIPPHQHKEEAAREAPLEMNPAVEEKIRMAKCIYLFVNLLWVGVSRGPRNPPDKTESRS